MMEYGIFGPIREKFYMELGLKSRKEFNKMAKRGIGKKAGFYAAYLNSNDDDLDILIASNDMHINALIAELEGRKTKVLDDILTPEIEIYLYKELIKSNKSEFVSYTTKEIRFEELKEEEEHESK